MLHDIEGVFRNQYRNLDGMPGDKVLSFRGDTLLMARDGDEVRLPTAGQLALEGEDLTYLFSIDGTRFFLAPGQALGASEPTGGGIDFGQVETQADDLGLRYEPLGAFRWIRPRDTRLAVEVGWQLSLWYRDNRYCGRCATPTIPDAHERMLRCPSCGNTVYPRINPGVIVGVIDGDDLLLTKYAGRGFTSWALVAGFTEVGESLEQTVAREVMEETGVRVGNIRYFGNQPWPRSSSALVGFFADLDGSRAVKVDETELACAEWVHWRDVPHDPDDYSLTRTMMCAFHDARAAGTEI